MVETDFWETLMRLDHGSHKKKLTRPHGVEGRTSSCLFLDLKTLLLLFLIWTFTSEIFLSFSSKQNVIFQHYYVVLNLSDEGNTSTKVAGDSTVFDLNKTWLGMLMRMLCHPVVKRSQQLTDRMLRLLAQIARNLSSSSTLQGSDQKKSENAAALAGQTHTSDSTAQSSVAQSSDARSVDECIMFVVVKISIWKRNPFKRCGSPKYFINLILIFILLLQLLIRNSFLIFFFKIRCRLKMSSSSSLSISFLFPCRSYSNKISSVS